MERLKRKKGELEWTKIDGGSMHFQGKIIKPGQRFFAMEKDIPEVFRDVIKCLEPKELIDVVEKESKVIEEEIVDVLYTLKKSKRDKELYDIFDKNNKVINEEPMTKKEGEETIKALG